jgi:hypothetical protein
MITKSLALIGFLLIAQQTLAPNCEITAVTTQSAYASCTDDKGVSTRIAFTTESYPYPGWAVDLDRRGYPN